MGAKDGWLEEASNEIPSDVFGIKWLAGTRFVTGACMVCKIVKRKVGLVGRGGGLIFEDMHKHFRLALHEVLVRDS